MVGLHIFSDISGIDQSLDPSAPLQLENWHGKSEIFGNGRLSLYYSFYKGYPVTHYSDDEWVVIYEGMIYNRTEEEVFSFCRSVGGSRCEPSSLRDKIGAFVESSDGDFILLIFHKATGDCILFNDYLGRLPFYYYVDSKCFVGGRSVPFLLHNMPRISIDRNALTEFLLTEFMIGEKTFFNGVKRLSPHEIVSLGTAGKDLKLDAFSMNEDHFTENALFRSKEDALDTLVREFVKATTDRIQMLESRGYRLINTLSGGFDSRAVFGAMNAVSRDFINVTYEYIQDESEIAGQLLRSTGSSSQFVKLSFTNRPDFADSGIIFNTGGSVNAYTTSVAYNDCLSMRKALPGHTDALFGGFGGEFIRHPFFPSPVSPYAYLCYLAARVPVSELLPVFNVPAPEYKAFLMSSLKEYKEKSNDTVYKHLYNEYYRNYVVGAGEDRTRMFMWTVQPFMATFFMQMVRKRIPLRWSSFGFFTDFLSRVDSRLLDVPVYGTWANLKDSKSIRRLTLANQKPVRIVISVAAKRFGWPMYRRFLKDDNQTIELEQIRHFYEKLEFFKKFINYAYIRKKYDSWPFTVKSRLLGVLMYLFELEKHCAAKLIIQP